MNLEEANEIYNKHLNAAVGTLKEKSEELTEIALRCTMPFGHHKVLDLVTRLEENKPKTIIELGSGDVTTAVFDWWQRQNDCDVTSVDEDKRFLRKAQESMPTSRINFILSTKIIEPDSCHYSWSESGQSCDLLYVDGPNNRYSEGNAVCSDANMIDAQHVMFDFRRPSVIAFRNSHPDWYFEPAPHVWEWYNDANLTIHHSYFKAV